MLSVSSLDRQGLSAAVSYAAIFLCTWRAEGFHWESFLLAACYKHLRKNARDVLLKARYLGDEQSVTLILVTC